MEPESLKTSLFSLLGSVLGILHDLEVPDAEVLTVVGTVHRVFRERSPAQLEAATKKIADAGRDLVEGVEVPQGPDEAL